MLRIPADDYLFGSSIFLVADAVPEIPPQMLQGGAVAHWRQELSDTLPKAGVDVPPLPEGAREQTN